MILNNLNVTFQHNVFSEGIKLTNCIINTNYNTFTGTAYCSPRDQFNKKKGRIIALTRAINSMNLSKDERTLIWAEYHTIVNTFKNSSVNQFEIINA